eukprot:156354-Chlamydomonas_euryale.AAC.2
MSGRMGEPLERWTDGWTGGEGGWVHHGCRHGCKAGKSLCGTVQRAGAALRRSHLPHCHRKHACPARSHSFPCTRCHGDSCMRFTSRGGGFPRTPHPRPLSPHLTPAPPLPAPHTPLPLSPHPTPAPPLLAPLPGPQEQQLRAFATRCHGSFPDVAEGSSWQLPPFPAVTPGVYSGKKAPMSWDHFVRQGVITRGLRVRMAVATGAVDCVQVWRSGMRWCGRESKALSSPGEATAVVASALREGLGLGRARFGKQQTTAVLHRKGVGGPSGVQRHTGRRGSL